MPTLHETFAMPWVHLFLSLDCNLRCAYCTQQDTKVAGQGKQPPGMNDDELKDFYHRIPPAHFCLSGGEPLIFPGVKELVAGLMDQSHMVSFDSNLVLPLETLCGYLDAWGPSRLGVMNISHHWQQVDRDYMLARCRLLKKAGVRFFVKYIAVPDQLDQVARNAAFMRDHGIGVQVAPMFGHRQGRSYPAGYTDQEIDQIIELITVKYHGLQIFEGVHSRGLPCRGGNDFICLRKYHQDPFIPCLHAELSPLELADTYFGGQPKKMQPCQQPQCAGVTHFNYGLNGIYPEIEPIEDLCRGVSPAVGREGFREFLQDILGRGYKVVNQQGLYDYMRRWGISVADKHNSVKRQGTKIFSLTLASAQKCVEQAEMALNGEGLEIVSLPQQWAYICQFDLSPMGELEGICRFEIDLKVREGFLGIGVLHQSQEFFLNEIQVGTSEGYQTVALDLPDASEAHALVLRTCAPNGQISKARIERVVLRQ